MTPADHADEEVLQAMDAISAQQLANRYSSKEYETTAEKAAADRQWTFGHVIVDEAQELSSMAWRSLMRRCPSRSMTIVGDISQRSVAAGAGSWAEVLRPYVRDRWRMAELTVNYRTPDEIMSVAADVLAEVSTDATAPRSVRSTGVPPWRLAVSAATGWPTRWPARCRPSWPRSARAPSPSSSRRPRWARWPWRSRRLCRRLSWHPRDLSPEPR
ncbi:hypothetical protein [Fodinicola feengrottensis]|uniref:hypothetical protein n=1 Tax=Fodinicola feengrottensis TaxID=435914 RepID=UPI0028BE4E0D|nr:hypothetical protein [Fodinicola feengrottensis]